MTTYESEIKVISKPQEEIFNILCDLSNLQKVQNADIEGREKLNEYFSEIEYDSDSLHFSVAALGKVGFRIIEREPFKTIKLESENSPIKALGWIQLVGINENETKMKITIKADLPMMVKMMVDSKLKKGIDTLADGLAKALSSKTTE